MAKVVRKLPNERRGSTYAKYLDGQKWQLTQGVDFKSVPHYVRLYLYQLCSLKGLRAITRIDGKHLYVQAVKAGAK